MLHEGSVAGLLEGALTATPPLMLPLKLMLLDECAHGYMHCLLEQLVLLTALSVITGQVPLRLDIVLILGNCGAARHLDRLICERHRLGSE